MPYFSAGMFIKLMIMITFQFMSNGLIEIAYVIATILSY